LGFVFASDNGSATTNSLKQTKATPHNTMFTIIKASEFALWLNLTINYKAKGITCLY
jgi:hypothetical protein